MGILNRSSIACILFILYFQPGNIKSLVDDVKVSSEQLRSPSFSHLVIDQYRDTVFIGAGDRLYRLLPNLTTLAIVSITWKITNIFIDYKEFELIVCGGNHSGYWCRFYSLKDPFSHGGDRAVADIEGTCTNAPMVNFIKNSYSTQNTPNQKNDLELCFANSYCEDFSEVSALLVKKIANIYFPFAKSASSPENDYATKYRNDYQVTYKYGFTSGKYNYILTTQRNYATLQPSHISKLIRICYNGESLWQGYSEIPIQCKSNYKIYNLVQTADVGKASSQLAKSLNITPDSDVLFAIFLRDQVANNSSNTRDRESALCIYSLEAINEKFTENIQYCFNGHGSRGFNITVPNPKCIRNTSHKINSNFCSSKENMPYVGNKSITESPVFFFNTVPTTIATKPSEGHNNVFIGTVAGQLKKIEVHNSTNVCQEAEFMIIDDGSLVNFDLKFSPNNDYLYVMTERTLTRMKIPFDLNCSRYHEYRNCLRNAPSYCGWCGSTNKCTTNCDCFDDTFEQWYDFRKDVKIRSSSSNEFQIGTVGNIQLKITNLPQYLDEISCNFAFSENKNLVTSGSLDRSSAEYILVICDMPEAEEISKLLKNGNYMNTTLSISAIHVPDIVKTNVKFFDCETYSSCKACNSSEFPCMWSPKDNKCKFEANTGYAQNKFVEFESNAIIPARQPTVIKFPNMKSYDVCETTSNLKCLISIEGNNFAKNVTIKNDYFYCENTTYKYAQKTWNATAKVTILWNTSTFSDILSSTNVVVYKCQQMAHNCDNCLTLDTKYKCGWCQRSNKCEFQDHCTDLLMAHFNTCPRALPPSILSFSPQKGPLEGGTNVTIEGESLGYVFEDINQNIEVAGVPCVPIRDMYIATKSITCTIKKSSALPSEGPVVVHVNNESVISKQNFEFVDPKIFEFFPNIGPIYGGTELTIKGENLDVGKLIQAFIGNALCLIFSLKSFEIKCVTNSSVETNATVSVKIDQSVRNTTNDTFKYVKDPERDEKGFNIQPKGIPAGGITILLRNVTLMSPQELIFHVHGKHLTYNSSCEVQNDSILNCSSPHIPDIRTDSIDAKNPKKLVFSITDNATNESIELPKNGAPEFLLYPNPEFCNFFNSSVEIDGDSFVIVKGTNINKACQKLDIRVTVGNYSCDVISISSNQLICRLPKLSSCFMDDSEQKYDILAEYDEITVSIGTKFSAIVPRETSSPVKTPNTGFLIYAVIILIIISIVSFTSVVFLYKSRKKTKKTVTNHLKILKKLQQQVNVMGMEAITTKQCIKRVIIKNKISLDENSSKILKLPEVEIVNTQVCRTSNGTSTDSEYMLPHDDKWEFPKNNLTLGRCLGEGEFGKVVQGEAKNILKENITTTVAVKMLKDDHSDDDMIDLVSEMEILKFIGTHDNVLRLLGCCTKDGTLFVITEYAKYGNLREFLRKHLPSDCEITTIGLSQKKLIMFAIQVARGMEYLASMKCIHRDLAARNVLVSENYILKIADFGLARDIRNKEYYRKKTNGRLPVKWMAPESLCRSIYSTQSDVWSYGILLWEIFTLGGAPYPSLVDVEKLYQALRSGYRMEKPSNCTVKIYSLMHKCWSFQPSDRPSFSIIVQNLEHMMVNEKALDLCNVYWPERDESDDLRDETDHLFE